jgi:hypothetical protein
MRAWLKIKTAPLRQERFTTPVILPKFVNYAHFLLISNGKSLFTPAFKYLGAKVLALEPTRFIQGCPPKVTILDVQRKTNKQTVNGDDKE